MMRIVQINDQIESEALNFLEKHSSYTMFLLQNIRDHGLLFENELNLPSQQGDDFRRNEFIQLCKENRVWGYFLDEKLISIANLNAQVGKLAQLGGVFTLNEFRSRGYSKAVIQKVFDDCIHLFQIEKCIIFTDEESLAAQKVYESVGAKRIGHYALLFR